MLATAASTASTPASMAATRVASWPPAVSWVCRCTGRSNRLRSALTSARAAGGRSSPAMSLIASTCAPARDDLLGQLQVVVQCVELLGRVGQVAGVAERDLGHRGPGGPHRVDGRAHLGHVVERVEDPEDVHPGGRGLLDEGVGHLGRVGRVADGVAPAQQHLGADVGHRLAQRGQPVPRVLGQEAQRHVVGRAAPALQRQQLRGGARHVRRHGQQVAGAHPGGQQRLVRVAERGVGDGHAALLAQPGREPLRPELRPAAAGTRPAPGRSGRTAGSLSTGSTTSRARGRWACSPWSRPGR